MNNIALSIEQMKHLEKLGLDTSDASMEYIPGQDEYLDGHREFVSELVVNLTPNLPHTGEGDYCPAYTLQDVIDKLPKDIPLGEDVCPLTIVPNYMDPEEWEIIYLMPVYLSGIRHSEANKNLLQGCYDMLCWCIENGYIKTK